MFDVPEAPEALLDSLELFLRRWLGDPMPWYGIAEKKLAEVRLPRPLRRLYAIAGEWPGDNPFRSLFAYQDRLVPFELLAVEEGKLVFLWENQGVWSCGTEAEGEDPPVWVRFDEEPWRPLGTTLAPFLVTACLHEILLGARFTGAAADLIDRMRAAGKQVSPLWLDGPYVGFGEEPLRRLSFHLVDGQALLMDDWCGTNSEAFPDEFPDVFRTSEPRSQNIRDFILTSAEAPSWIRRSMAERAAEFHEARAARHVAEADEHRRSAEDFRRLAKEVESGG